MTSRRIFLLVCALLIWLVIIVFGIRAGLSPQLPAGDPSASPQLWWPSATVTGAAAGTPPAVETDRRTDATVQPDTRSATETAARNNGLTATTARQGSVTVASQAEIGTQPPPTDPLACLPTGAASDPAGDIVLVSWVSDGASIVIDRRGSYQTVQLIGIDAPPSAEKSLTALLQNQVVRLVPDGPDRDPRGRLRRYVLTLDGDFINYELLRSGKARLHTDEPDFTCRDLFESAQALALESRIGLWGIQAAATRPPETRVPTSTPGSQTPVALLSSLTPTPETSVTATGSVTAALSPSPSATGGPATPTATPPGEGFGDSPVIITNIFYLGTASKNESDEYIEIMNSGDTPFTLTGYSLYSDSSFAEVYFPDFILQPGQSCRVYTNEIYPNLSCAGLSFARGVEAWDNESDCGGLYNPDEESVYDYCY